MQIMLTLSPKFSRPTARPPSTTVKCSQDKKVLSFAKKTLGSTLTMGGRYGYSEELLLDKISYLVEQCV
jgi:hypothetical protein